MIADTLFKNLNDIITIYPEDIVRLEGKIEGTAFFPGGDGLYEHKNFAQVDKMILGHDFDNECNFNKSKAAESEIKKWSPTWSNLKQIFKDENPSLKNFFFTNAIMGLRKGKDKNTGRSKAFNKGNEFFLEECRIFFKEQVKVLKPKLIIGLGRHIPKFLSECANEFRDLSKIKSLKDLRYTLEENIFKDVVFKNTGGHKTNIIFITHPSIYTNKNVNSRLDDDGIKEFGSGKKFEYELIKEACRTITC